MEGLWSTVDNILDPEFGRMESRDDRLIESHALGVIVLGPGFRPAWYDPEEGRMVCEPEDYEGN